MKGKKEEELEENEYSYKKLLREAKARKAASEPAAAAPKKKEVAAPKKVEIKVVSATPASAPAVVVGSIGGRAMDARPARSRIIWRPQDGKLP